MRLAVVALVVACTPAPRAVVETAPVATPAIDIPALAPPPGVRLAIGLGDVGELALSPTGETLAIASGRNGLQLLDVATVRGLAWRADLACTAKDPDDRGSCLPHMAFSGDGRRLAAWWPSGKLVVLAIPTAQTIFEATVENVMSLVFLDDGRLAALRGGASYLYDPAGKRTEIATPDHPTHISPDGHHIMVDDLDAEQLRILDATTHEVAVTPPRDVRIRDARAGGGVWVASTRQEWSDIVTWKSGDASVRTLASSQAARERIGGDGTRGFAFPPPYDRVYVGMDSALVAVALDGRQLFRSAWGQGRHVARAAVAAMRSGVTLLSHGCVLRFDRQGTPVLGPVLCTLRPTTLGFDGAKIVASVSAGFMTYDARTGVLLASKPHAHPFPDDGATLAAVAGDPELEARIAAALALPGVKPGRYRLARDHERLFVTNEKDQSSIIDLTTNRARTKRKYFTVSGDGTRYASLPDGREDVIEVRTVDGEKLVRTLPVPTILTSYMALSDDGRVLAAPARDRTIVQEVETGKVLLEASCRAASNGPVVLSRDGRLLVCATDGAVEVHDVQTRALVKRVAHARGTVDAFALSPDGKQLAIAKDAILLVDL